MAILNVEFIDKEVDPYSLKTYYHFMVDGVEVSLVEDGKDVLVVDEFLHPIAIHLKKYAELKAVLFDYHAKFKDPFYDIKILQEIRILCSHGEYENAQALTDSMLNGESAKRALEMVEKAKHADVWGVA